jgi:hypothetical protein
MLEAFGVARKMSRKKLESDVFMYPSRTFHLFFASTAARCVGRISREPARDTKSERVERL